MNARRSARRGALTLRLPAEEARSLSAPAGQVDLDAPELARRIVRSGINRVIAAAVEAELSMTKALEHALRY